jgi:DNA-binding MarR family transcriptional regulator
MQIPPLTQSVGSAERSMRALLEQKLQEAGLSFPAWTVLVFINASPLSFEQVTQKQISGHVVSGTADTRRAVDNLIDAGLITANESAMLTHTEKGSILFMELSGKIKEITQALYGDLPSADLEATHRTLIEIAKRANSLLLSLKP